MRCFATFPAHGQQAAQHSIEENQPYAFEDASKCESFQAYGPESYEADEAREKNLDFTQGFHQQKMPMEKPF